MDSPSIRPSIATIRPTIRPSMAASAVASSGAMGAGALGAPERRESEAGAGVLMDEVGGGAGGKTKSKGERAVEEVVLRESGGIPSCPKMARAPTRAGQCGVKCNTER